MKGGWKGRLPRETFLVDHLDAPRKKARARLPAPSRQRLREGHGYSSRIPSLYDEMNSERAERGQREVAGQWSRRRSATEQGGGIACSVEKK